MRRLWDPPPPHSGPPPSRKRQGGWLSLTIALDTKNDTIYIKIKKFLVYGAGNEVFRFI